MYIPQYCVWNVTGNLYKAGLEIRWKTITIFTFK